MNAVVWSRFDTGGGREAAETILAHGNPHPTALFAVNDFAAIGAMGALRSHGLSVGRDVAVVGFNDTSLAAELPIPLSSVRSPMLDIGRTAVQLLKGVLDGGGRIRQTEAVPCACGKAAPAGTRCDTASESSSQSNQWVESVGHTGPRRPPINSPTVGLQTHASEEPMS